MKRTKRIKNILEKNLLQFSISISDDSFSHKGHNNFDGYAETHIIVELKKNCSSDINRLEIHKKINFLLSEEFNSGLHSLQIKII
jgi:stress-induced morphogen